ncbi:aldehyde dehydrogenase (NADP(+)) [Kribbella sandramycini]|uniref:Aldehyde dehydrogenase (NADP(+)) n=1 Tax=Kribbella sandramycini TaxID=60450 RepID=A0A7Y4KZ69_9ACTN|nr:aldehyde dehydrogenase (NADP(+)) [Kribbella sandramycini]MBB6565094.1 NADP-dependent aldehyde dehydrogenase [Kribbella sandramycini]NOL41365.1 aldehyde dehydrogenase (NADP(+)) [Kribbella sandramycini]
MTPDTTPAELEQALAAAAAAAPAFGAAEPAVRAGWIRTVADALDAAVDELVPIAMRESSLPEARLRGEVARSTGQLRLFADALVEGSLLEVVIDTADAAAKPVPRPDLRRVLVPLGPVLVFAASNFPFAFSVCGGDTASAFAAGCPVVVKGHPGHPELSVRTAEVMIEALRTAGAPDGAFGLIQGFDVGVIALKDPRITAAGFTGSVPAGKALHEIAVTRPEPIPFYGELGSLNPVFVTQAAIDARGKEIATGYVGSFTLGVGQFCTKPGLLFLPVGHGLQDALTEAVGGVAAATMLNERIKETFDTGLTRLEKVEGVRVWGSGGATLLQTTVGELLARRDEILEECFGPVSIVVEYDGLDELRSAIAAFDGNLTATLHAEETDNDLATELLPLLTAKAGRVLWNGWPTGVAVSWAQHHGGPFPSTVGSIHTSVGVTAARRFQRPVAYQDAPDAVLPAVLRDANPLGISRRIDGAISTGEVKR